MADQFMDDQIYEPVQVFWDSHTVSDGCNTRKKMLGSIGPNPTNANENETYHPPKLHKLMTIKKLLDWWREARREASREARRIVALEKARRSRYLVDMEKSLEECREAYRAFKSESVQIPVEASQLEGWRGIYHRRTVRTPTVPDDGYSWKRYDQKEISNATNATYPRICFRCFHKYTQGCQASRWVQKIESDPVLYKVTYIGRHTCKQLPQWEGMELLILSMTFVFEGLSLIFEKLNYPLFGTVMGNVGFIICIAEFCYRARTEQVALMWRGKLPLLYSRYPIYKPFGSMLQWFGLGAACRVAVPQLLHYATKNEGNFVKILITMVVLCICLAFNKILKEYSSRILRKP